MYLTPVYRQSKEQAFYDFFNANAIQNRVVNGSTNVVTGLNLKKQAQTRPEKPY